MIFLILILYFNPYFGSHALMGQNMGILTFPLVKTYSWMHTYYLARQHLVLPKVRKTSVNTNMAAI